MKQFVEGHYYLEGNDCVELGVLGNFNGTFQQFILLYYYPKDEPEEWSIVMTDKCYDIPGILFRLSEEEYFQLSTIWDCPYNLEYIRELQRYMLYDQPNWDAKSEIKGTFDIELEY